MRTTPVAALARAAQLLRLPDIKIQDIAFELGYTDPAHFTRFFVNVAGVSPLKYRHLPTDTQAP
jgi:AraC-like DNA-binding protein